MLNDRIVVGAATAGVGGRVIILAIEAAVAHGLRAAEGRARHVGNHSKLAHRADVAIATVQGKAIGADARHGVQTRIAALHSLAL